jgi:alpha-mannosidase
LETPGGQVPGKSTFEYAIIPHQGDWRRGYQQAYAFETSLRAVETQLHEGEIADQGSFISHSPAEFIISAVKEAENGEGWIVRGYNISSETVLLQMKPSREFPHIVQVNLGEEEVGTLDIEADGTITTSVSGHEIVSILFSDQVRKSVE